MQYSSDNLALAVKSSAYPLIAYNLRKHTGVIALTLVDEDICHRLMILGDQITNTHKQRCSCTC